MEKNVKLVRKIGNLWRLSVDSRLLVEFSVIDQIEAVRFANNWLSSFPSIRFHLEVPIECNLPPDPKETRVPKDDT